MTIAKFVLHKEKYLCTLNKIIEFWFCGIVNFLSIKMDKTWLLI